MDGSHREQACDEPEMLCLIVAPLVSKSRSFLGYLYYGALTEAAHKSNAVAKAALFRITYPTSH